MTISKALWATINTEMEAVEKYRAINMGFYNYSDEYSRLMGQISVDKAALLAAKMPPELFEKYPAYLYVMTEEHALRQLNEYTGNEASKEFDRFMPAAEVSRDVLLFIAGVVIDELNDPTVTSDYRQIFDGESQMSKLNDIIALTSLIGKNMNIASTISLPGIEVTQEYLDLVRAEAHRLIDLKGEAKATVTRRACCVDRQKRILTLCRDAEDKIKRYAKAAFFMKKDYYDENYVNHYFREKNRKRRKVQKSKDTLVADLRTSAKSPQTLAFDI